MSVWVIIPVKPLRLAKSRLSSILTPEQRQRFAEAMLRQVLQVVESVHQVTGVLVISRDNRALALAREHGAKTVQESGNPELNAALMRATQIIASWGADSVLVLPADLPLIHADDIREMIRLGANEPSVVISTDRNQDGTNALFVRPPGLIEYAFGEGSYQRHKQLGAECGATVRVYDSERLIHDIDLPEDIDHFFHLMNTSDLQLSPSLEKAFEVIHQILSEQELN